MKKVRIIILFMTLFLSIFFIMPAKVLANTPDGTAADWFNHISQFDAGFAYCEPVGEEWGYEFGLSIVEEPAHEVEGWYFDYNIFSSWSSDLNYFEPSLKSSLNLWAMLMEDTEPHGDIDVYLADRFGEDFDGYLYWNFEEGYWQIEYYEASELDYYMQRVEELEDEISSLEDEISSLEDEISSLEDEISSLEDEISLLEGLLVENNNDITKWFVPLVVIIIVVGIIEPIILIKRRG